MTLSLSYGVEQLYPEPHWATNHGQGDDAAHQGGEQGPVVEQGRVLPER